LGIIIKKLRDMIDNGGNEYNMLKDFKYDSLLIEHELQDYISKQNNEEKERLTSGQLLDQLEEIPKDQGLKQGPTTQVKEKEPSDKDKDKMFNASGLPTWARTSEPVPHNIPREGEKKEEKPSISGKWLSRLENQDKGNINAEEEKQEKLTEKKQETLIKEEKKQLSPIKEMESRLTTPPFTEEKKNAKRSASPHSTPEERREKPTQLDKQALPKDRTPEPIESDGDEPAEVYKPGFNLGHGVQINVTSVEKVEEDIPEEYQEKFESLEDLIEENLEEAEENIERAIRGKSKSPTPVKGVQQEKNKFIEQNYDNLDEEIPKSPERKPEEKSLSSIYFQNKSNTKDLSKEIQEEDIEIQLKDENEEITESQGLIKYKAGPQARESLFDVNAIKSQVSNVSKTLETLEQQLASKDTKPPKNFSLFDQSRNFLSSFDVDTEKDENLVRIVEPGPTIADQLINNSQQKEKSPNRHTPERNLRETEKDSKNLTPNNSGVLKVDKRNLIPTTLEQLAKKQVTPNTSQVDVGKYEGMEKDINNTKETRVQKEEENEENPHELTIKSEKYEFKPDRFTLQPSYLPDVNTQEKKIEPIIENTEKDFPSPFATNFGEQSSIRGSEWEDAEPITLSYNTSAFQKVVSSHEERIEAEIEESFNIIKSQLRKIDTIMKVNSNERNFALKERLTEKFEKGYDETRRSIDMLGVRSSRSMISQYSNDISQNMSEMVIANSKDLLENYSRMLLKTFEKQLEEKLGKKL